MATTITTIAADYDMQVPEVTAALDLGRDYDEHAELDEATEATYREVLDIMAEQSAEFDA